MTNQFFDLKRFESLVHKTWVENNRLFGLAVLIQLLWTSFLVAFWPTRVFTIDMQKIVYLLSMLPMLIYANYFINSHFTGMMRGVSGLMLPASVAEKMAVILLYLLLFFLLNLVVFYITLSIGMQTHNGNYDETTIRLLKLAKIGKKIGVFDLNGVNVSYACWVAFMLCGGVYFTRFSFLKTVLLAVSIYVLFAWGQSLFFENVLYLNDYLPARTELRLFGFLASKASVAQLPNYYKEVGHYAQLVFYTTALLVFMSLIAATYFRLKEKQI